MLPGNPESNFMFSCISQVLMPFDWLCLPCSPPPPIPPIPQFPWRLTCTPQGFRDYYGNTWVGRNVTVPLLRPVATASVRSTTNTISTPGKRFRGIESMFSSQCTGVDSLSLSLQVPTETDLVVTFYFVDYDGCVACCPSLYCVSGTGPSNQPLLGHSFAHYLRMD
jgi:hypothetical protein